MYLQIENLKKFYGQDENKVEVLRGINCGIEKSEKLIKKTWQEFRDALSKGDFSYEKLEKIRVSIC